MKFLSAETFAKNAWNMYLARKNMRKPRHPQIIESSVSASIALLGSTNICP